MSSTLKGVFLKGRVIKKWRISTPPPPTPPSVSSVVNGQTSPHPYNPQIVKGKAGGVQTIFCLGKILPFFMGRGGGGVKRVPYDFLIFAYELFEN